MIKPSGNQLVHINQEWTKVEESVVKNADIIHTGMVPTYAQVSEIVLALRAYYTSIGIE